MKRSVYDVTISVLINNLMGDTKINLIGLPLPHRQMASQQFEDQEKRFYHESGG